MPEQNSKSRKVDAKLGGKVRGQVKMTTKHTVNKKEKGRAG